VINQQQLGFNFDQLNAIRLELIHSTAELIIEDYGAGSLHNSKNKRKVSDIARNGISTRKNAELLFRLVHHFKPSTIIELGTSMGLTSLYLASANTGAKVITIEGSVEVSNFAKAVIKKSGLTNITVVNGLFDNEFPKLINTLQQVDFLYVDGNHKKQATISYFEMALEKVHGNSVLVFDDIHWSSEMEEAWHYIQQHPKVTISLDVFFFGIVFFVDEPKAQFKIRF